MQDIWDALQPSLPGRAEDELDQCITALNKHFSVVRNVPYECHLFRQLNQSKGEMTVQLAVRLQKQAQFCDFADATDQLRDQLLQGMIDPKLREKLLEEPSVKLEDAMKMASRRETASLQAKTMAQETGAAPVGGHHGHYLRDWRCPARGQCCNNCGKVGHL